MRKKYIKLINSERKNTSIGAEKACVSPYNVDICGEYDGPDCTAYSYDCCTKRDYGACTNHGYDWCSTDYSGCNGGYDVT